MGVALGTVGLVGGILDPAQGQAILRNSLERDADPFNVGLMAIANAQTLDSETLDFETLDFETLDSEALEHDPLQQVTSVSQLRDVQPTDWALQALQSLVERYGCIAGYPDKTYRGDRALSRYEFAAGLNACMDRVNELMGAASGDKAKIADLETLRQLQIEFAAEIAALRGRGDALEARTDTLARQQFSRTTKLSGNVFFNVTGAGAGNAVLADGLDGILPFRAVGQPDRDGLNQPRTRTSGDPEITFSNLVWLSLTSSFSGQDFLRLQLATGNGISPANQFASAGLFNTWGTPYTDQTAGPNNGVSDVVVRELNYSFPVSKSLQFVVGPRINFYRYFDDNAYTFFLFGTSSFNSISSPLLNASKRGAGAIASWTPSKQVKLNVGYLSQSIEFLPAFLNSAENPSQGLFNGTNTLTAELTYTPTATANLRLLYSRSRIAPSFGGLIGGGGLPVKGFADDGFGGDLRPATADTFGLNFDWRVAKNLGLFGRYAYGHTRITPVNPTVAKSSIHNQSMQLGLALLDLGKPGAQGSLSVMVPSDVLKGRNKLISGGGDGGTQVDIEATYSYPLTDEITLVPSIYAIIHPNNFTSNPTVWVGNLRLQFSF
jgi:Carbohydrate-selective porin, OprB family/S-layer homology domain